MPLIRDDLEPIAIIGLACRFPGGANSPEELWQMLAEGRSGWSQIPADRYTWRSFHHPNPDAEAGHNQKGGGYINRDLAAFDAAFFNIPAAEANGLDPQQRIHLETAYEALESAGLSLDSVKGSKTSVHVATVSRDYDRNAYRDPQDLAKYQLTGCGEAITSGRVSYTFDLRGPCFSLDTGCSGSLVGLHLAVQGLRSRETDMALVGGTNLLLSPDMTIAMSKLHMLNDDGKCYAFDSRGKGYARSEGVATIVLKRLADAVKAGDPIRAIVRNTGMNQDGKTNGIMLPNSQAQEDLMRSIHLDAGLDPIFTGYVEAHGTGTRAGDAAEINSISKVFCTGIERTQPLFVGSIKANFGHCESASGLAGLIKTVLALEKGVIPATPDVLNIKEGLEIEKRNIRIPQQLEEWPALGVRRAAINSFGYGGTNVAAVLDSYESIHGMNGTNSLHGVNGANGVNGTDGSKPNARLFVVSAKSSKSLVNNIENLKRWISSQAHVSSEKFHQLANTLATRRSNFPIRTSFLAATPEDILSILPSTSAIEKATIKPTLTLVFTGQGAQWYAMGRELLHTHSSFATSMRKSERILKDLGADWSLFDQLTRDQDTSRINESAISQPACTALQIALVDLLESFFVRPDAVVGHSSGEIAAAYAAGALTHAAALYASFHRSKVSQLVKQVISTPGGMLVTTLSEADAYKYIERIGKERLSLACINSPSSTTISGDKDALLELKVLLEGNSVMAKLLAVDVAYHSHHMKAVAKQYFAALQGLESVDTRDDIQFFSSVTGKLKNTGFGPDYWVENLVSTVRFPDALFASCEYASSSKAAPRVFLEVGPHSALAGPARQTLGDMDHKYVSALVRGKTAYTTILTLAGKLFEFGVHIDIEAANAISDGATPKSMIVDLPPYAWDYSNRYWHESRLSKEYRFRRYPYHDLLGLRLIGSTPLEPLWRNILSLNAQPWLSEHVIDGFAILPGSSFLTMAMEAARQLNDERGAPKIKKFHMKKVNYFKAIMIPEAPGKVEVMISLSAPNASAIARRDVSEWETFRITSSADTETWNLNCVGQIRLEYASAPNEVDGGHGESQALSYLRNHFSQIDADCTRPIDHDALYEEMRRNGIDYGTNFATIKELRIGECQAIAKVVVPDVAQCMPSGYQQPHTIHPATFDALMHIVLPLYSRHCSAGTAMLTSIEEIIVSTDIPASPGSLLDVCAALSPMGPRSGSVDVTAFDKDTPVVILRTQKFQGIAARTPSPPATYVSYPLHSAHKPLRMAVITPGVISSLCFVDDEAAKTSLRPDEVEIKALAFALDEAFVDAMLGRIGDSAIIGECAGIITAVGSDMVHSFRIGERVCGWNTSVAFATRTRVKGSFVQRIPDMWSFKEAAALPMNMSLAYHALRDCAQLEPGQTLLINNAGGALGQAVAVIANLLGLVVVATVRTKEEKEAIASSHGTRPAQIHYSGDPALDKTLLRLTEGAGIDAIINASSPALSTDLVAAVKAFGTVIDLHQHSIPMSFAPMSFANRAIRYVTFDAGQFLRHYPSVASASFKVVLSLLPDVNVESLMPIIAVPITEAASAFKSVQAGKNTGKAVLLADDDAQVNVKEAITPVSGLANVEHIIERVSALSIPHADKEALLALIKSAAPTGAAASAETAPMDNPSSAANVRMSVERRLGTAISLKDARSIVLAEQVKKISSLVSVNEESLDTSQPLADLGLDSLIAIEFKDWLGRSLGVDIRVHDILDADGLAALAKLVVQKSKFVPEGLPEEANDQAAPSNHTQLDEASGSIAANDMVNGTTESNSHINASKTTSKPNDVDNGMSICPPPTRAYRFTPNQCPKFPVPPLDVLMEAYLHGVKAFATSGEFENTVRLTEEFKKPGGKGRILYERALARYADPTCENWEHELQLRRGFLDRRIALFPVGSFWFSHPISEHQHSQAERAALLAFTANQFRLRLEAGMVKPVVLNEQELTTAYHPYIFNTVRVPGLKTDEMERYPGIDHCIVFWRGHSFRLDLVVNGQPVSFDDLLAAFTSILSQDLDRSNVSIFTSDNRPAWAGARQALIQLNAVNAATIAAIESSAFVVALDEASPSNATERAKQFHFGGQKDASNRWHDKSLQFVVCSNGISGLIGEHSMVDAMTLNELMDSQIEAIGTYSPLDAAVLLRKSILRPVVLPLTTDATLDTCILKVKKQFTDLTGVAGHVYLHFDGYGSNFLRAQKLAPKSVFQMVCQLASFSTFGFLPPCFETVNQAHYHLGRVDIIQVVVPAVAAFVQAARDASTPLKQRRALLVDAARAHVTLVNKAGRNLGWERNLTALRALAAEPDELPELYKDPVHDRVRPRVMQSHCFNTGMMEKGCMQKDPGAIWSHYEVYEDSVYWSIVSLDATRAEYYCENLKESASLVKQIVLAK